MRLELTRGELDDRRTAAARIWDTPQGKEFVSYLLDDLGLWDVAVEEPEMILHNFALVVLKRYFGISDDYGVKANRLHRAALTEAIIGVEAPKEMIDG